MRTKLILIEGLPGLGKTTTARNLAAELRRCGLNVQEYWEWSDPHPIDIGGFDDLAAFIPASGERQDELVEMWRRFAQAQREAETVTVMESRFWQTTAMLMLAAGCAEEEILHYNRCVVDAIRELHPALIYFSASDPRAALERTIQVKNAEWAQDGRDETWAARIFSILRPQKWFTGRDARDLNECIVFFEEWARLAEKLYAAIPFPKVKIEDPYRDWARTGRMIGGFLGLSGGGAGG